MKRHFLKTKWNSIKICYFSIFSSFLSLCAFAIRRANVSSLFQFAQLWLMVTAPMRNSKAEIFHNKCLINSFIKTSVLVKTANFTDFLLISFLYDCDYPIILVLFTVDVLGHALRDESRNIIKLEHFRST